MNDSNIYSDIHNVVEDGGFFNTESYTEAAILQDLEDLDLKGAWRYASKEKGRKGKVDNSTREDARTEKDKIIYGLKP